MAKDEARRRRSKRLAGRGYLAVFPLLIGMVMMARMRTTAPIVRPTVVRSSAVPVITPPTTVIEYVQTDPTITDRLTLPPVKPRWTSIDDRELIDELAAAGQPMGIVCMNGKAILLPR